MSKHGILPSKSKFALLRKHAAQRRALWSQNMPHCLLKVRRQQPCPVIPRHLFPQNGSIETKSPISRANEALLCLVLEQLALARFMATSATANISTKI